MIQGMGRTLVLALALAAVPMWGCAAPGDGGGRGAVGDAAGQVIAPDNVARIQSVDRSTASRDGRAKYVIENVSGADQEDLVWSVTFWFPPEIRDGIEMPEVSETTGERALVLLRGEKKAVDALCPDFQRYAAAQKPVLGTRINLQVQQPILTVPRNSDGSPGTRFVANKLECVGMIDDLYGQSSLWIEFENVSATKLTDLELQIVFPSSGARTKWKSIPSLAPGQRSRIDVDLGGVDVGDRSFTVKVRQQAL